MTSDKKIEANRRNAQNSTGPTSKEGKEASKYNAGKHFILTAEAVLPWEDRSEYEEFHDTLIAELDPEGTLELQLAERYILQAWRLLRVSKYEYDVLLNSGHKESPLVELGKVSLYETRIERSMYRALEQLRQIKRNKGTFVHAKELEQRRNKASAAPEEASSPEGAGEFPPVEPAPTAPGVQRPKLSRLLALFSGETSSPYPGFRRYCAPSLESKSALGSLSG